MEVFVTASDKNDDDEAKSLKIRVEMQNVELH